jgi:hypothetical protein
MSKEVQKPNVKDLEGMLKYLDALRESGTTNMFGAAPYLVNMYGVDIVTARKVLSYWMETFGERN